MAMCVFENAVATTVFYQEHGMPDYERINKCMQEEFMEWISVNDRLPKDDEPVLVYHWEDFHITVGYFEAHNVSFYIESDDTKFYTDDGWETEIPWAQKGRVTHWMPLPAPPKDS